MSADPFHWQRNPIGLYRDIRNAKIAGVCAGLARDRSVGGIDAIVELAVAINNHPLVRVHEMRPGA